MEQATARRSFEPNAVLIPEKAIWSDNQGEHADPEECTLLYLDGDRLGGELFTKEQWEREGQPSFALINGQYSVRRQDEWWPFCPAGLGIRDQEPVEGPRIQLLPDMWILKVNETRYWTGLRKHRIKRVFGVYALNKRSAHYLCEMTPSYELTRFDSQWDWSKGAEDFPDFDRLNEAAWEHIRGGDADSEDASYVHCHDVEKRLGTALRVHAGDLPKGSCGGYRCTGLVSVTEEDALEEIRECTRNGDL